MIQILLIVWQMCDLKAITWEFQRICLIFQFSHFFFFFLLRHFNGSCGDLYPLLCCVLLMSLALHWSFKSHNIEYHCVISMYMFNLYCSHNMHTKIIAENIHVIFLRALMGLDTLICRQNCWSFGLEIVRFPWTYLSCNLITRVITRWKGGKKVEVKGEIYK